MHTIPNTVLTNLNVAKHPNYLSKITQQKPLKT